MKLKKYILIMIVSLFLFMMLPVLVFGEGYQDSPSYQDSPIGKPPSVITESVTINGATTESYGYIARYDESGNEVEKLKAVSDADIIISSDITKDENLNKILDDINSLSSLSELNSDLDKIAQKMNSRYNSSVFVISNLFELTLSDELLNFLSANKDCYYDVKLSFSNISEKPVVMHLSETENEWLIVDDSLVSMKDGYVDIRFNELCPVMTLNANESNLSNEPSTPWVVLGIVSFIAGLSAIYLISTLLRKKQK